MHFKIHLSTFLPYVFSFGTSECFTIYPVNKTDPVTKTTKQEYDVQSSLGTIRFDKYVDPYFFSTQLCLPLN